MHLSRICLALLTTGVLPLAAPSAAHEYGDESSPEGGESAHHGHAYKNEIVLGIGLIHEGRDNDIAGAFEYGRRLTEKWGVGIIFERLWGNQTSSIIALPVVRNFNGWNAMIAPGVERRSSGNKELIRIGASWHVETGIGLVIPGIAVDFLEVETILVLGAGLGFEF